ncbi:MAG: DUF1980 domain-containing protein [Verrucomicrobia bacterium]|nr:DUF1980 domain-containing protein [Verrucomicrobiota bacterium]
MNPKLCRILFSLAILSWSVAMLYFHASGRIAKYLAPDFRLIALIGGLGLAVLGLFNLLTAGQQAGCDHDHSDSDDAHCHDHESSDIHPLLACVLMVLPLAVSVAWTKDEYSAAALSRKGLYDAQGHRKTADGFYEFNLMELYFATGDREMQTAMDGLKIETEGRLIEERTRNAKGSRKRLYRLLMSCCAADSRAIPIVLEYGNNPMPAMAENQWVKVAGTMNFPMEEGLLQPILTVDRTIQAEPPFEESFLRNQ